MDLNATLNLNTTWNPNTALDMNGTNSGGSRPGLRVNAITSIYYGVIGLVALTANGSLAYIITSRRKLWKIHYLRLCSMCLISIILTALYYFPYYWAETSSRFAFFTVIHNPIRNFLMASFSYHLVFDTLDKVIIIAFPFRYKNFVRPSVAAITLIFSWLFSFFAAFYPVISPLRRQGDTTFGAGNASDEEIYHYVFYSTCVIIPYIFVIICQSYIFVIALRHIKKIKYQQCKSTEEPMTERRRLIIKKFKAARPLIITTATFIVLTLPYLTCLFISFSLARLPIPIRIQLFHILIPTLRASSIAKGIAFSYPAVNPLIFAIFSQELRHSLTEFFRLSNLRQKPTQSMTSTRVTSTHIS